MLLTSTLLTLVACAAALPGELSPSSAPAAAPPVWAPAASAPVRVLMPLEEALELAFPGCKIERSTEYLTEAQVERAGELAGRELTHAIVHPYTATKDGKLVGTAYVDTHRVRTLRESVLVVVDPKQRVKRIEVLAFAEPEDYILGGRWYGQFLGKPLDDELNLKRGIRGVTGATLTAVATTEAVRRVLAVHRVIHGEPAPQPQPSPKG